MCWPAAPCSWWSLILGLLVCVACARVVTLHRLTKRVRWCVSGMQHQESQVHLCCAGMFDVPHRLFQPGATLHVCLKGLNPRCMCAHAAVGSGVARCPELLPTALICHLKGRLQQVDSILAGHSHPAAAAPCAIHTSKKALYVCGIE